jgi:Gp37 protein
MDSIGLFEDLIISKLKSTLPAIDTQAFPIDPADLGLPVTESQIFVAFERDDFGDVVGGMTDRTYYQQPWKLQYQLILRLMDFHGQRRSYDVLNRIRDAVTGLGAGKLSRAGLRPMDSGFKTLAEGLWVYQMRFAVQTQYTLEVDR